MQPKNKNTLRDYFTFSARERKAIYWLLALTTIFFLLPHFLPYIIRQQPKIMNDQVFLPHKGETLTTEQHHIGKTSEIKKVHDEVFPGRLIFFDPNTASLQDWQQLGVREKTAQTILRYRQKGGRFKVPEDLKKIWGLSPEIAERLIPWVRIEKIVNHASVSSFKEVIRPAKRSHNNNPIDINSAAQAEWEELRGIGPGLASRIIKFRDQLGGFISIDQVKETYGLPDSTFQQIRSRLHLNETFINRLSINQLDLEQLARHPYIRYKTAKAIIAYREQHGRFQSVKELEKIESISAEIFLKIEKYLTVE